MLLGRTPIREWDQMDYAEGKDKSRAAKSESSPDGTGNVTPEMVL